MTPMKQTSNTKQQKTRELVLATASGGMAIALGTLLSIFTVIRMPQGGSFTIGSMLPIIFCALAFGPVWGFGICTVYGVLQFVVAPFTAHWASVLLDYPVAFGLLGIAGFFAAPASQRLKEKNILRRVGLLPMSRITLAVLAALAARLMAHIISGVVFFGYYAPEGQNVWLYSLIYNGTYMVPEMILTALFLVPLAYIVRPREKAKTE
jgi:thiamine transporter